MKKFLKVLAALLIVFVLAAAGGIAYLARGLKTEVALAGIDLSKVKDGAYTGEYKNGRFSNTLELSVEGSKIKDIKVVKDVTFAKPDVTSQLFEKVKSEQNTKVDVVTGATVTSKSYLKAMENAFINQ